MRSEWREQLCHVLWLDHREGGGKENGMRMEREARLRQCGTQWEVIEEC